MPRILEIVVIVGALLLGLALIAGRAGASLLGVPGPRIQILDPETAPMIKDGTVDMTAVRAALSGEADQTVARLIPTSDADLSGSFATDNPDTTVDDVVGSITQSDRETTADGTIVEDESGRELFRLPSGQLIGT